MRFLSLAAANLLSTLLVLAHPGHDIKQEVEERTIKLQQVTRRDLSHCSAKLKASGYEQRIIQRRAEILRSEREKRGLPTGTFHDFESIRLLTYLDASLIKARELVLDPRDAATVLNTSHLSPITYHPYDPLDKIFAGNKSCILVPEVTEGPYYVSGEFIRSDVREAYHQQGIDLLLDVQAIDVATCEPVPNLMIDLWYANSTGVYSGVVVQGNGDSSDATNINATHGRGLQATDHEGVARWTTFYPGHYSGRTQHIHVATHYNGTYVICFH